MLPEMGYKAGDTFIVKLMYDWGAMNEDVRDFTLKLYSKQNIDIKLNGKTNMLSEE